MSIFPHFFIAGTDTDSGKTFVSLALLQAAKCKGWPTAALKPVAAGVQHTAQGDANEDALLLQAAATTALRYQDVNPLALPLAIAPHIAAAQADRPIVVDDLLRHCKSQLNQWAHSFAVVEGAGGWRVPLDAHHTMADMVRGLGLPVILVVGLRLGCLNHALLTVEAIARDGLPLAGWVANQIDHQMLFVEDNICCLRQRIEAPYLGHIPFMHNRQAMDAAQYLDIDRLLASHPS
ncbi:MAG: dethiobiotin synthase [Cellvibrionaceae bacterium]|nr:dethiobiotin synthase [Cellvibrionaceae bacterium]